MAELETQVILSMEFAYLGQSVNPRIYSSILTWSAKCSKGCNDLWSPTVCRDLSVEYFGNPMPSTDNTQVGIESVDTNAEARRTMR